MTRSTIVRWIRRSLAGLLVALPLGGGGGLLWLSGSPAQTEGRLEIAALSAPVELLRDRDGLVTIRAQNERDAYLALGFVHAQDRLWQMDFMRRSGAGRLSEVVGPGTLGFDRLTRTLGFARLAEANLARLGPATRAALEAYTAGVNAYLENHEGAWPPEFYLLRYRPEPWRPEDSLLWGRLMALQLSGNWSDELRRMRLAKHLTPEQIDFLWPRYPGDAPVTLGELAARGAAPRPARLGDLVPWDWAPKSASNAWVLSGARSATGKPILANDPHLGLSAPGVWYLVRIETPDLTLAGASAPGVPFVIVGHNGKVAWGMSTTEGDTQDLFIERPSEGRPDHYDTPDGPRPFETRRETIAVRGAEPELLDVRATRHGPIVSDLDGAADGLLDGGQMLALSWPALAEDDGTAEALYALNHAGDAQGVLEALESWHSPQQTISFADTAGSIGLVAPARVPQRRNGDGRSPQPGWTGEHDWQGFVPYAALPRALNPPRGLLVAANNRLVPKDYPYLITADWQNPYRAERIEELLASRSLATPEDSAALQQDTFSTVARELVPRLLAAAPEGPALAPPEASPRQARALLAAWDFRMARTRPEPLLFYAWLRQLNRLLLADELGEDFADFARADAALVLRVLREGEAWCDDVTSPETETCDARIAEALTSALDELGQRFGKDMTTWRWGAAHLARFRHPVFSRLPVLAGLVDYEVEADGGSYTVNRGGVRLSGTGPAVFEDVHGPGYRAVYDLADLDRSRFMIATGQSGNPFSAHYGDLAERWRDGAYLALDGTPAAAAARLRLVPPAP